VAGELVERLLDALGLQAAGLPDLLDGERLLGEEEQRLDDGLTRSTPSRLAAAASFSNGSSLSSATSISAGSTSSSAGSALASSAACSRASSSAETPGAGGAC